MKYINPRRPKVSNAHPLLVSCQLCQTPLLVYLKGGNGGLIKIQWHRVIESNFTLEKMGRGLHCIHCGEHLGSLRNFKGRPTYYLIRGLTTTKKFDHYTFP